MFTTCYNLSTGEEWTYTLPPAEAVERAYQQSTRSSVFDDEIKVRATVGQSGKTVFCGDWSAMIKP